MRPAPPAEPVPQAPVAAKMDAAVEEPAPPAAAEEDSDEPASYLNVMQLLVEEKADEAIGKRLLLPEDREACVEHAVAKAIKYGLEGGC